MGKLKVPAPYGRYPSDSRQEWYDHDEDDYIRGRQPLTAGITATSSGNTEVVAASAGNKIRVLSQRFGSSAAVTIKWRSGASSELVGGGFPIAETGGISDNPPEKRWIFETAAGEALNINLSGNANVGGAIQYELVAA